MMQSSGELAVSVSTPPLPETSDWVAIFSSELPVSRALAWAALPSCGALITFCGTVRDHSVDRPGVTHLEYEAYEPYATRMMAAVALEARERFPQLGRLVLLHRVGVLSVNDVAVVIVVSAAHRHQAYGASRFCIDTVKRTIPIWKRETWDSGSSWITCDHHQAEKDEGGQ